ncbi:MAG: Fur family transcriptional regulator, partial [Planctomycetota bacterium]
MAGRRSAVVTKKALAKDELATVSTGQPAAILEKLPTVPVPREAPGPFAPACATFRLYLRRQKLKFTPERAVVLDAVLRQDGLFDAETIADVLKAQGHRGSRATVYRTLGHLQEAGLLRQVNFGGGQAFYEALVGQPTHDYLVDIESGEVVSFHSEALNELRDAIAKQLGFDP